MHGQLLEGALVAHDERLRLGSEDLDPGLAGSDVERDQQVHAAVRQHAPGLERTRGLGRSRDTADDPRSA
jgi:hypothetical protein